MTVCELVDRYLKTKTGVREGNRTGYVTAEVRNSSYKLAQYRHIGAQFFEDRVQDYDNITNDENKDDAEAVDKAL